MKKMILILLPLLLLPSCGKAKFNFDCKTYRLSFSKRKEGADPYECLYKRTYLDESIGLEAKELLLDIVNSDFARADYHDHRGDGASVDGWYNIVFDDSYNKLKFKETVVFPSYFIEYSDGTKSDMTITEINEDIVFRIERLIEKLKPILEPLPWTE